MTGDGPGRGAPEGPAVRGAGQQGQRQVRGLQSGHGQRVLRAGDGGGHEEGQRQGAAPGVRAQKRR